MKLLFIFAFIAFVATVQGYNLVLNASGPSFFDNFNFETESDPTDGFVDYQSLNDARSRGLINTNNNQVYIGADHSSVPTGRGRASVRLSTKKTFNSGLFILDLTHMPTGCGTWPAWWTVGPNWPFQGEIDIIEGVNNGGVNQATLHTNPGCDMSSEDHSRFTGNMVQSNCAAAGNAGCGVQASGGGTYGSSFNGHQGGVYAMEWTGSYIQVFYFARGSIPGDIQNNNPNPGGWGKPFAWFQLGGNCPNSHFSGHSVVFDLTFCGDWAGAVFGQQCPGLGDCVTYVKNNPNAFSNAFWTINYMHVYV